MEQQRKQNVNISIIGHPQVGKSTTFGHLIYKCGGIDQKTMDKYTKESADSLRATFKYFWIFNKLQKERNRGITIVCNYQKLDTEKFLFTFIDCPGHRDFIRNTISGISQADIAVLIVAAGYGEFDSGISKEGQTYEHSLLAFVMGVRRLIVCINKMDTVNWSEIRFNEIKEELSKKLSKIGYRVQSDVQFIPTSGWLGDQLVEQSKNLAWSQSPTLLETLNNIQLPKRSKVDQPLRISISNIFNVGGVGIVTVGKVLVGTLKPGMKLTISPENITCECFSIESHHNALNQAQEGDYIGFNIRKLNQQQQNNNNKNDVISFSQYKKLIKKGCIASESNNNPADEVDAFKAKIYILDHPGYIRTGYTPILYCHTIKIACKFEQILQKIDRKTGKVIEEEPEFLQKNESAIVLMRPIKEICVEPFKQNFNLGSIIICDVKQIIAIGTVLEVYKKQKENI